MFLVDPVLNKLKKFSWKTSYIWIWISLIIWMLMDVGIGSDIYVLPLLIGLILLFRELIINDKPLPFISTSFNHSIVKKFYVFLVLIVLTKTLLSLYSFRWNIFDVGSYSSVVFNFSNGLNFNSFLQIPATADHFTLSLAIFAPLYLLGGVQLLFLGIVGEYIGKIYSEVKNRPRYIIQETFNFDVDNVPG